ncbi:hypothetical protein C8Q76DRAFT_693723 [Earliella scabrosa]|nr:hypothetical protein C8Q76DRAFT_693723 [Earliella scabrosa]
MHMVHVLRPQLHQLPCEGPQRLVSYPPLVRTVDLTYSPEEATFDFPTLVSLAHQLGVVELVVWHQDVLKLDEAHGSAIALEGVDYQLFSTNLVCTRNSTQAERNLQLKLRVVALPNTAVLIDCDKIYSELVKSTLLLLCPRPGPRPHSRTPSLNPQLDAEMLFHVPRYETSSMIPANSAGWEVCEEEWPSS